MTAATAILRLQRAGFTQEQVEALAEFSASQVDPTQLVTKTDLKAGLDLLEQRMTVRLGAMIAAGIGLVTVAVKLL